MSFRYWLAQRLRFLSDRIHPDSAFRHTGMSFHFKTGHGIIMEECSGRGCPLWYQGRDDYELAHQVDDVAQTHGELVVPESVAISVVGSVSEYQQRFAAWASGISEDVVPVLRIARGR